MAETPHRDRIAAVQAETPDVPAEVLVRLNGGRRPGPQDLGRLTEKARGAFRTHRIAQLRTAAVLTEAARVESVAGQVVGELPSGQTVEFDSIKAAPGYPDGTAVIVRLKGAPSTGEADVIIVNPPIMVPDHRGTVDVRGIPHREDPLGAIAQTVANLYGGGR